MPTLLPSLECVVSLLNYITIYYIKSCLSPDSSFIIFTSLSSPLALLLYTLLSTLSETDASTCGFLGSGKTSTLQNLLQITGGYKVGVVINDVASVNIDAKYILFSSTAVTKTTNHSITTPLSSLLLESSDVVELQNGCACCFLHELEY